MPYLEVSLVSPLAREWLPEEEMARIIEHIRLTFPYRSGEHFYRSSSDYLVIQMAKARPAKTTILVIPTDVYARWTAVALA